MVYERYLFRNSQSLLFKYKNNVKKSHKFITSYFLAKVFFIVDPISSSIKFHRTRYNPLSNICQPLQSLLMLKNVLLLIQPFVDVLHKHHQMNDSSKKNCFCTSTSNMMWNVINCHIKFASINF